MARKKLSEFRAKRILSDALGLSYAGISINFDHPEVWRAAIGKLSATTTYVVKVDQGVKGRFKKGLVRLNRKRSDLENDIAELAKHGYQHLLIEPFQTHKQSEEKYLAMERKREGIRVSYAKAGGVDIEADPESVHTEVLTKDSEKAVAKELSVPVDFLVSLQIAFERNHFSFLEINPLVVSKSGPQLLDAAVEVDDAADFFVEGRWNGDDFRKPGAKHRAEMSVAELDDNSQASFSLEVINPDGSIFLLLSGGGASVVVADEVHNLGLGRQLGNYGEYSGNPSTEETYLYTGHIIGLLLSSGAPSKVLIIAGGVANFTDVRSTFKGVIQALQEHESSLKKQGVKVYVRRGGPHEREGLQQMESYLKQAGLHGRVAGPELLLSDIVQHALAGSRSS